ncbi:MAG: metallophosphoesterase [Thiolinea sp.]
MSIWFISDLHLEATRPDGIRQLFDLLERIRPDAEALYILGDFFEYWIGDDVLDTAQGQAVLPILQALQTLKQQGTALISCTVIVIF